MFHPSVIVQYFSYSFGFRENQKRNAGAKMPLTNVRLCFRFFVAVPTHEFHFGLQGWRQVPRPRRPYQAPCKYVLQVRLACTQSLLLYETHSNAPRDVHWCSRVHACNRAFIQHFLRLMREVQTHTFFSVWYYFIISLSSEQSSQVTGKTLITPYLLKSLQEWLFHSSIHAWND